MYASALIEFDGRKNTVSQMSLYKQNPDRAMRKACLLYTSGKSPFEALVPRLQEILSGARRVVAYNDGFEKAFLDAYGIPSRGLRWGEDPMAAFAQQMGGHITGYTLHRDQKRS